MRLKNTRKYWRQCLQAAASGLAIAVATFSAYKLHFNAATVVLLYLLIIVGQSLTGEFVLSALVSLVAAVCMDFFFLPPLLTFRIADPPNILAFVVFIAVALVITRLVSRQHAEAHRAQRRGRNLEQLYHVAWQLLLAKPVHIDAASVLKTFRQGFGASAACLFDAETAELHTDGLSQCSLAERTRQAYILGKDTDDPDAGVVVRCLRAGSTTTGAVGFEGLPEPEWVAGPLAVLAAATLEQARAFRKASHEVAAAQAEVFRTAILDALGHEFKTPLATILAVVGGLRESQRLGPEEVEMTGMIESETSRLSNLTTRLLRMAQLDRDEVKPRLRNTNMMAFVERVVHRYTTQFPDRQIAVTCQGPAGQAAADRELLDLAMTQLLDNAFKYSTPGSAVTVGIGVEEQSVAVLVRNEGVSIPPQEQDRIFERFYRGTNARKLVSGAGLGLYVARKIAVAHGGRLDLDNRASPGSVVFRLTLPMLQSNGNHTVAANN